MNDVTRDVFGIGYSMLRLGSQDEEVQSATHSLSCNALFKILFSQWAGGSEGVC